jgi:membrane-associated phospholipid phosphatase
VALVPLALLLTAATVYGHLHYAVDAIAGAALGAAVLFAGRRAGYDASSEVRIRASGQGAHR